MTRHLLVFCPGGASVPAWRLRLLGGGSLLAQIPVKKKAGFPAKFFFFLVVVALQAKWEKGERGGERERACR